jgi:hypothetical protein
MNWVDPGPDEENARLFAVQARRLDAHVDPLNGPPDVRNPL